MEYNPAYAFFTPYLGTKPYLFVSYAHKNSSAVLPVIKCLRYTKMDGSDALDTPDSEPQPVHGKNSRKVNRETNETLSSIPRLLIWYDEGIPAGADWAVSIGKHMNACNTVLFFPSKDSFASGNCLAEIRTAKALHKTVYCMPLDNTPAPDTAADGGESWKELMEYCSFLPICKTTEERVSAFLGLKDKLKHLVGTALDYHVENDGHGFNLWIIGILLAGILLLVSLGYILGLYLGYFKIPGVQSAPDVSVAPSPTDTPTPVPAATVSSDHLKTLVHFPDTQQENIIRTELKIPKEQIFDIDLYPIVELYVFATKDNSVDPTEIEITEDGKCRLNKVDFSNKGKVSDLSVFGKMKNLQKLALIKQPVENLFSLGSSLERLTELSLACSDASSLKGITDLPNLSILDIRHTKIREFEDLKNLKGLKTVYVTKDMLPLTLDADAVYDVILVK